MPGAFELLGETAAAGTQRAARLQSGLGILVTTNTQTCSHKNMGSVQPVCQTRFSFTPSSSPPASKLNCWGPPARGAPVGTSGGSRGSAPSPALVFRLCPLAGPPLQLSVPERKRGAVMLRVEGLSRGTRTKSCGALRAHEPA